MKKHFKTVVLILLIMSTLTFSCSALSQDTSYMYNGKNESYTAPVAYSVGKVLSGIDMGTTALNSPQDLYVHDDGTIYIADTKNNRIVIVDSDFNFIREVSEFTDGGEVKKLNGPKGIFYGPDNLLYICDTGNNQIIALDGNNNVVKKDMGKDLVAVNPNLEFKPEKIAVDKDLTIYVVDSNVYQGIYQYDSNLKFQSFFAPNEVKVSAAVRIQYMWKNIFSDEMNDYMQKTLPAPYNNIFMSSDNYIYTTAMGVELGDEVKCLNALGKNILVTPQTMLGEVAYGDLEISYEGTTEITSEFVDIHCDDKGIISALDTKRGRIFQYDKECNLVCIFGGMGSNKGSFVKPVAIEKLGDEYIVLDSSTNSITTFIATDYIRAVYSALDYYNKGLYEDSVDLWQNVLSMNNNYTIAYKSIGRAYLQQGYYKEAMDVLKEGNDKYFYSMALKEYRKEYIRANMWWMVILVVVVLVGVVIGAKRLKFWLQSKPYPKKQKKG